MESPQPLLLKLYSALSPSTPALIPSPPFPSPRLLSLPSTQTWIVDHILATEPPDQDDAADEDGAALWKKVFWRRVVKGVEEGFALRAAEGEDVADEEVHEELLGAVVKYLPAKAGPPGRTLRTYWWGPAGRLEEWKMVKTVEEGKIISAGTTGLRTWHACILLSNHLLALHPTSASSVLELGAGVGLLSLLSARSSPIGTKITSTDVDEHVLERLSENILINGLENAVRVSKLDWDWSLTPEGLTELSRWETDVLRERPQLIIGADIVYDPSLTEQLARTLAFLLRPHLPPHPSSSTFDAPTVPQEALIAGTIRFESTWTGFISHCHDAGLKTEIVELLDMGEDGIVGGEGWEGEGEVRLVRISWGGLAN